MGAQWKELMHARSNLSFNSKVIFKEEMREIGGKTADISLTNLSQQKRIEGFSEVYLSLSTLNSFISYILLDTYLHMYTDTRLIQEKIERQN